MKFMIPSINMGYLDDRIKRLNRTAKKLKCPEITTKVLSYIPGRYSAAGTIVSWSKYEIEIEGVTPQIPGWEFLGTLEHTPEGNILRSFPGHEIPESFRHTGKACHYCNKARERKDTYVVREVETNQLKQVGHSCIRDFLGHVNPEWLAWIATIVRDVKQLDEDDFRCDKISDEIEINFYLEVAAQVVLNQGYFVSRTTAELKGGTPTSSVISLEIQRLMDPKLQPKEPRLEIKQEAVKLAGEALDWIHGHDTEKLQGYLFNLYLVSKKTMIGRRDQGILASLVTAYQKSLKLFEKRVAREPRLATLEYVGQVGVRQDFTLVFKRKLQFEGDHGRVYHIVLFEDAKGNQLKWGTGTELSNLEENKTYAVKATVKKFEEYKGARQTVLTRVSFL